MNLLKQITDNPLISGTFIHGMDEALKMLEYASKEEIQIALVKASALTPLNTEEISKLPLSKRA